MACDPDRVERRPDAERLDGTWLYGGTWASVFGHFLVETLTTLWLTPSDGPAGLVFHSNFGPYTVDDWHRRCVDLAGWGGLPIRVIGKQAPVTVNRLVVPGRSVALHAWAHPQDLEIDAQLRAVASASVLAGLCGSGLHHSAFIPPGGRVLELGDARTGDRPVRMQRAIDAAMDHEGCFLSGDCSADDVDLALGALDL